MDTWPTIPDQVGEAFETTRTRPDIVEAAIEARRTRLLSEAQYLVRELIDVCELGEWRGCNMLEVAIKQDGWRRFFKPWRRAERRCVTFGLGMVMTIDGVWVNAYRNHTLDEHYLENSSPDHLEVIVKNLQNAIDTRRKELNQR